jgi:GntR family transcriptional regulator
MALDKKNPIPLYYQLAEQIREQIKAGALKPGAQLPSERELSEQAAISRMTVRQAIAYLEQQGVLAVRQGVGTFVAEPKLVHDTLHLLSFTEEMMRGDGSVSSQVLEQLLVKCPAGVAAELGLVPEAPAVKIVRLRLSKDIPLLLETIFVPANLCPGLEQEELAYTSLYTLMEAHYRLRLKRTRQTMEATLANEYESELFGIAPGTPMILVEGVTYLAEERPAEYFKAIYRGDRFKFEVESYREAGVSSSPQMSVILASEKIP